MVVKSIKATENDLKQFHCSSYIDLLKETNSSNDLELYEEQLAEYGLDYDCPLLERNFDFVSRIAGGTLTASILLCRKISQIAINWFGGWHHAQRLSNLFRCDYYLRSFSPILEIRQKDFVM